MWSAARTLAVSRQELNLDIVLRCGQSFRWKQLDGWWTSTLQGHIYRLCQQDDGVQFCVWQLKDSKKSRGSKSNRNGRAEPEEVLRNYFQLDVRLTDLLAEWKADPLFQDGVLPGIRTLRQDPLECLMSFILSSCNNISRISQMVDKLCSYGPELANIGGVAYHDFPALEHLLAVGSDLEPRLRKAGFGYRAAFVAKAVASLEGRGGEGWLRKLRDEASYEEARTQLMTLAGVGRKVADCVCLMALDKPIAVPVDTHVFQIARRHMESLRNVEKCSPAVYPRIVDWFTERYGPWSGWAQGVLFASKVRQDEMAAGDGVKLKGASGKGLKSSKRKRLGSK